MFALLGFYAFFIGAIVGSFLNVVIYRYPRELSVVRPRSHCPSCDTLIRWFDNIPVLSYLFLGARCRNCRSPISVRYPLIELANGLFYLAVFLRTGPTVTFLLVAATVSMTLVLIFIDLEIQILPDVIDLPGIVIGIAIGWLSFGARDHGLILAESLTDSLIGAALGGGLLLVVALTYKLIRHIDGMGLGDVKMMAMIGAVSGWKAVLSILLVSAVAGSFIGIGIAIARRSNLKFALPFGVFLGLGFLTVLFFGAEYFAWLPTLAPTE